MIALITLQELQGLTAQQLGELHQFFTSLLAEPVFDEAERRVIRATLENIERTMGYAGETDATRLHNIALANIIGHGLASPNKIRKQSASRHYKKMNCPNRVWARMGREWRCSLRNSSKLPRNIKNIKIFVCCILATPYRQICNNFPFIY